MASIVPRNGKYAVVYYEGDDKRPVWKSGHICTGGKIKGTQNPRRKEMEGSKKRNASKKSKTYP